MTERKQLVPTEKYLTTGSHIGTIFKNGDMMRFIFKKRKDGLFVLDVENIDKRIQAAAQFLSQFPKQKMVVVARRLYSQTAAKKFAELLGCMAITGRFVPGTFTNPRQKNFLEPSVVIVTDPEADNQAVTEATKQRIPILALASTHNSLKFVDLAIPINNRGRKSLALVFWVLCRELLKLHDEIKSDDAFTASPEEFEYQSQGSSEENGEEAAVRQAIQESQRLRRKAFGRRRPPSSEGRFRTFRKDR